MSTIQELVQNQRAFFETGVTIPVSYRKEMLKKTFCLYYKIQQRNFKCSSQ